MRIHEITTTKPQKPKSAGALRLDALRRQKEQLQRRINAERGTALLRKSRPQV